MGIIKGLRPLSYWKEIMKTKFPLANCVAVSTGTVCSNISWAMPVNPVDQNKEATCVGRQEVENTMSTVNTERNYLNSRLTDARYTKRTELEKHYKIYEDMSPHSYKELIEWIKNDKYELNTKRTKLIDSNIENEEHYNIFGCFDGIIWNGRGKADYDGHKAAESEMQKQYQSAKDVINTDDAKEGLKALQEFEAWFPKGFSKKH